MVVEVKGKTIQICGPYVNPKACKEKKVRKRCRHGSKAVGAACVKSVVLVEMALPETLHEDISFAKDYLMVLPQRIKEVQEAADAVLKAGARQ